MGLPADVSFPGKTSGSEKNDSDRRTVMGQQNIYYFDKPGPDNTDKVMEIVRERYARRDIQAVIVASTTGKTIKKYLDTLHKEGARIICVTEHPGFTGGDKFPFDARVREELQKAGIPLVIASHALSGVGRSISTKFGGVTPVEIIAHSLRLLGQGTKVGVEISVMAADAGVIATDREVICVAGTGSGSDTATVLRPAHMNNFFDLQIREILAKPRTPA
jgi:hypothetical protein